MKQLCKKSFENELCENFTYKQKRTISVFIKTLQIKLLPLSAAKQFTLEASQIPSIAPLGNKVCTAIKCSVSWSVEACSRSSD